MVTVAEILKNSRLAVEQSKTLRLLSMSPMFVRTVLTKGLFEADDASSACPYPKRFL